MNADGTEQTKFTGTPDIKTDPVWSPDGQRIDFEPIRAALGSAQSRGARDAADVSPLAISGEPDQVVERVKWLHARGATQINIGPPLGLDKEHALRLTAERVVAKL